MARLRSPGGAPRQPQHHRAKHNHRAANLSIDGASRERRVLARQRDKNQAEQYEESADGESQIAQHKPSILIPRQNRLF
jgi:hypothetical protein